MKTFLIVLILIFSLSLQAREKDSALCHYGFVMDYTNTIADEIGFKYRPTKSIAYFFKGSFSTQEPIRFNGVNYSSEELRTYGATLGVEYSVYLVDKFSSFVVIDGSLKISDVILPYYAVVQDDLNIIFVDDKEVTYSLSPGFGVEYHFSKHLSIGFNQAFIFTHKKGMSIGYDDGKPFPSNTSKVQMGHTKFTLSFYF